MLCFVDADWPLIGGAFNARGVTVLWPKKAIEQIAAGTGLDAAQIDAVHRVLAKTPVGVGIVVNPVTIALFGWARTVHGRAA